VARKYAFNPPKIRFRPTVVRSVFFFFQLFCMSTFINRSIVRFIPVFCRHAPPARYPSRHPAPPRLPRHCRCDAAAPWRPASFASAPWAPTGRARRCFLSGSARQCGCCLCYAAGLVSRLRVPPICCHRVAAAGLSEWTGHRSEEGVRPA
jgi:hypothetical protein